MQQQDWGTMVIYSDGSSTDSSGYRPQEFGSSNGNGGPPGAMNITRMIQERRVTNIVANGLNVFNAAKRGDVFDTIDKLFVGLTRITADQFKNQMRTFQAMNLGLFDWGASAKFPLAVTPEMVEVGSTYALVPVRQNPGAYDFYGTPLMLGTALNYWINGGGQDRTVHISSLNIHPSLGNFRAINDALKANGPGTYPINAPFSVNLFDNAYTWYAALVVGRIGGNVSGTLTINSDNTWSFNGSFTMNPDFFNADHSNRPYVQERFTDFLRQIGDTFGHQDYNIIVIGSQPVSFSGTR